MQPTVTSIELWNKTCKSKKYVEWPFYVSTKLYSEILFTYWLFVSSNTLTKLCSEFFDIIQTIVMLYFRLYELHNFQDIIEEFHGYTQFMTCSISTLGDSLSISITPLFKYILIIQSVDNEGYGITYEEKEISSPCSRCYTQTSCSNFWCYYCGDGLCLTCTEFLRKRSFHLDKCQYYICTGCFPGSAFY